MRGFILGVLLLTLIGWCMVHETIKQTRARYELAEEARRETEMLKRLEKLRAEEESLLQPTRLAKLAKELKLDVASLSTTPPPPPVHRSAGLSVRLPGEAEREPPGPNLAAAGLRQ
ncbi:MAG: hypothetical protein LBT97_13505 [Planctomycetota bacterium]|jgi:hypothetical protein|nr:hypothetical protein [Planctomycetota bacterium]